MAVDISDLRTNRSLGASALLYAFAQRISDVSLTEILDALFDLKEAFPAMAIWPFAIQYFSGEPGTLSSPVSFQQLIAHQQEAVVSGASHALRRYSRFATLSRSSLVERTLINIHALHPINVMCTFSLPAGEGRDLHGFLTDHGVETQVFQDWEIHDHLHKIEALIMGADWIMSAGFINKAGSLGMCEQALSRSIPVYVLAEGYKCMPTMDPQQIPLAQDWSVNAQTRPVKVFEYVPFKPLIKLIDQDFHH